MLRHNRKVCIPRTVTGKSKHESVKRCSILGPRATLGQKLRPLFELESAVSKTNRNACKPPQKSTGIPYNPIFRDHSISVQHMSSSSWTTSTSCSEAHRRAGGRRAYNKHRQFIALMRRHLVLDIAIELNWRHGWQKVASERLGVERTTIWRDMQAIKASRRQRQSQSRLEYLESRIRQEIQADPFLQEFLEKGVAKFERFFTSQVESDVNVSPTD